MALLQPKLNLRVSQKQILTPGLVQMVSVLALNKLELRDMINAEMVENPVLEELDSNVPLLDEVAKRDEERERESAPAQEAPAESDANDPFNEIDFGSFFRDYLDPGYRSPESEYVERPSFENFLSRPATLTDHLMWQLGSIHLTPEVREAAELVIGNLNEDGYLTASEDELLGLARAPHEAERVASTREEKREEAAERKAETTRDKAAQDALAHGAPAEEGAAGEPGGAASRLIPAAAAEDGEPAGPGVDGEREASLPSRPPLEPALFSREVLREAIAVVRQMDPVGVASRDLKECLLAQLQHAQNSLGQRRNGNPEPEAETAQMIADCTAIIQDHLKPLQNKDYRVIARALGRPLEAVTAAVDFLRTLDPRPGLRYNLVEPRLIEPDVAFVKQGDEYVVVMNDEDIPQLRLNPAYKRLLSRDAAEKDVRSYVKERYKSAIQLIKNIEQRKQTILKVCYAIIGRQREFLDQGIDQLKPMMIKDVAEEIGVHPSTVSRAVANKYAHTPQGVFELRYFFSESVQGPEGGGTPLLILKRRVKKLIEEEDPARPLTDEQITRILQSQGIQVTRRTVAKYREDMRIPSTHQRRVKKS
jgi:RNA polymerase sigma-54 factor